MNYGFFVGIAVFAVVVIAIQWRKNLPKNLAELRAFAFLEVMNGGYYNHNGANRIAGELGKSDLIKLAPMMRQAIREHFNGSTEQMLARAVEQGYEAEESGK